MNAEARIYGIASLRAIIAVKRQQGKHAVADILAARLAVLEGSKS